MVDRTTKSRITRIQNQIKLRRLMILQERLDRADRKREELEMERDVAEMEQKVADLAAPEEEEGDGLLEGLGLGDFGTIITLLKMFFPNAPAPAAGEGAPPVPMLRQNAAAVLSPPTQPDNGRRSLSLEELRALREKVPAPILAQARLMSDDALLDMAKMHYPDLFQQYDDATIERALVVVRE